VKEYEIVYVLRPDLSDEERSRKIERIHGFITENGGEVEKTDDWGKRVLAYEINHYPKGSTGSPYFSSLPKG